MVRVREFSGAVAMAAALLILPLSGAVFAHGGADGQAAEFEQHMDTYVDDIHGLIATVDSIVADYEPGEDYSETINALTQQWESVDVHLAIETNAPPLYPPIWLALGEFSTALEEAASLEAIAARGDDIAAALWQGYGALKLLAAQKEQGHAHADGHGHEPASAPAPAGGAAVIDTINGNLDQVLALYKQDQNDAAQELIYDTYMDLFEGVEGDLIEQDAKLVSSLEADFNASLPALIKNSAPATEVAAQIDAMKVDLETARELLVVAEQQESPVF